MKINARVIQLPQWWGIILVYVSGFELVADLGKSITMGMIMLFLFVLLYHIKGIHFLKSN